MSIKRVFALALVLMLIMTEVCFVSAETKTMYVNVGSVGVYKKASSSSDKLVSVAYGASVTVYSTENSWCKLKYGSYTGYAKASCFTSKNPNTLSETVYVTSSSVKIYVKPNTDSEYTTVSTSTALKCTAVYDKTWCRVVLNGNVGFVKKSQVTQTKSSSASSASSSSSSKTSSSSSSATMYICEGSAGLYKKADSGSTKLTSVVYGTKVTVTGKSGSWSQVKYGSYTGYIKTSCLTSKNPNTLDKTVYVTSSSVKIYQKPNTSSDSTTVSTSTALKCTAIYDSTWCRVTYNGNVGFVKKNQVSEYKTSVASASSSSSSSSAQTKTMYVSCGSASVYKSDSTDSTKLTTLVYGASVTVTATSGSWATVKSGSKTGYMKTSVLTSKDPNTLNNTVYVTSSSVKIYASPSTDAKSATVSTSAALTATALYDGTWYRVKYNGNIGFVKKSQVSSTKLGSSTASPASGQSVAMDWFTSRIQSIFYRGCVAVVTDVKTGISWKVKRTGGSNHADVQPLTAADTAAMKKACGSDFGTWNRRSIWVSIDGKKYAASMNCKPHGEGSITDNNFDGHHCIHFTNSKTHGTGKVDADHQAAIKKALAAG